MFCRLPRRFDFRFGEPAISGYLAIASKKPGRLIAEGAFLTE